ncbi:protein PTHB1 [Pelomyxa schiedti]|nr:protein PTHB1 [Pelomyxa schiedti]
MSLFRVRQWWSTKCGSTSACEEEFEQGSLCATNIDNAVSGDVKIITGSLQGFVRIFSPHKREFAPADLLLEHNVGAPILQIAAGRFVPTLKNKLGLAVLHPRKLVVYIVEKVATAREVMDQNTYYALKKQYEHQLEHAAFNFVCGPFGGIPDKDLFCVQSLDGVLSFFEQDSFSFQRYLTNFLVPGPICYVSQTDSIVMYNSQMQLECFKYSSLVSATAEERKPSKGEDRSGSIVMQKHLQVDWVANLGEHVQFLFPGRFSSSLRPPQIDIIAICERHIFCLTEGGQLRLQKRLDSCPSYAFCYNVNLGEPELVNQNMLVSTYEPVLNVYKDMQLLWAAKLPFVPVSMTLCSFCGLQGLIAALGSSGELAVQYLGTDPASAVVNTPADVKDPDYGMMQEEMSALEVKSAELSTVASVETPEKIEIRLENMSIVGYSAPDGQQVPIANAQITVLYNGPGSVSKIRISICLPKPFKTSQKSYAVDIMGGSESGVPLSYTIDIWLGRKFVPSSMSAFVVAVYQTPRGEPRVSKLEIPLPLALFCSVSNPTKLQNFKVHFDTNRPVIDLKMLFNDIAHSEQQQEQPPASPDSANSISFVLRSFSEATIIASKIKARYRVQSDSFGAMWLIVQELVRRLGQFFQSAESLSQQATQDDDFEITNSDNQLPLEELFQIVDHHFQCRKAHAEALSHLSNVATQFRVIERRLLIRFRDENAVPLNNLDILLRHTYAALLSAADAVKEKQTNLQQATANLSSSVKLFQLLLKLKFNLDEPNFAMVQSYFTSVVDDKEDQGWEENVELSLNHAERVMTGTIENVPYKTPTVAINTEKFKFALKKFCTKISDGLRLVKESAAPTPLKRKKLGTSLQEKARRAAAVAKTSQFSERDTLLQQTLQTDQHEQLPQLLLQAQQMKLSGSQVRTGSPHEKAKSPQISKVASEDSRPHSPSSIISTSPSTTPPTSPSAKHRPEVSSEPKPNSPPEPQLKKLQHSSSAIDTQPSDPTKLSRRGSLDVLSRKSDPSTTTAAAAASSSQLSNLLLPPATTTTTHEPNQQSPRSRSHTHTHSHHSSRSQSPQPPPNRPQSPQPPANRPVSPQPTATTTPTPPATPPQSSHRHHHSKDNQS